jgi:eukaryotic-like serine/threonine-protein kinase
MAISELTSIDGTKKYQVKGMLGEGGQGKVLEVSLGDDRYAVKWYAKHTATQNQRDIIERLVPKDPGLNGGGAFIWPKGLVCATESKCFGYLMDKIDRKTFRSLGELMTESATKPFDYRSMAIASANVATCFRALHARGLAYRDINRDNVLINHANGDVRICDNDNVGVSGEDTISVVGTFEYMAPELILVAKTAPSQQTDLYSLAVYLFYLWMWHHPLEGKSEARVRVWDDIAKKSIYAEDPVFIFNEEDLSNALPNESRYNTCRDRWNNCPKRLKDLFTIAFTEGLKDPQRRVTEGQWIRAFNELEDGCYGCRTCKAKVFVEFDTCWACGNKLERKPAKLCVSGTKQEILMTDGKELLKRHFSPLGDGANEVLGRVGKFSVFGAFGQCNKGWGIENLVQPNQTWVATTADGKSKPINHSEFVEIQKDTSITIDGRDCHLTSG